MTKHEHHKIVRALVKDKKGSDWIPITRDLDKMWDSLVQHNKGQKFPIELFPAEQFKIEITKMWGVGRFQVVGKMIIPIINN